MVDQAEIDRLDTERACAMGRVIARIELYDEGTAMDRPRQMRELLDRCRELAKAHAAVMKAHGIEPAPEGGDRT